jgi:hypothetical protein
MILDSQTETLDEKLEDLGICSCCGNVKCGTRMDHIKERMRAKLEMIQLSKELEIELERKAQSKRRKNIKKRQKQKQREKEIKQQKDALAQQIREDEMLAQRLKEEDDYIEAFKNKINNMPIIPPKQRIKLNDVTRVKISNTLFTSLPQRVN